MPIRGFGGGSAVLLLILAPSRYQSCLPSRPLLRLPLCSFAFSHVPASNTETLLTRRPYPLMSRSNLRPDNDPLA